MSMSYIHRMYNAQIGVVFAILVAGIFLLALCIGGVYFGVVKNMRTVDDEEKKLRAASRGSYRGSGRSAAAATAQLPPPQQAYYQRGVPPPQSQIAPSAYDQSLMRAAASPVYQAQHQPYLIQQHSSVVDPLVSTPAWDQAPPPPPLVTPYSRLPAGVPAPLQAEFVLQQGPTTYYQQQQQNPFTTSSV